jgi:hypothetical protein
MPERVAVSATHRQMRGTFACAVEAAIVGRAPTSAGECPADLLKFSGADFIADEPPREEQSWGSASQDSIAANSRMGK